ncbi:MAG: PaaI family thioesterase [Anaerolineae bacterium]
MCQQPTSRMCFVCGRQNPFGLKLQFYEDHVADQVKATVTVPEEYQGYPGVVHGGIVSTILDEVSGRALMLEGGDDSLLATLRMTVRFLCPTPTDTPITAVGWVKQMSGVGAKVAGEIRLPDGSVTAECESLLADPPESVKEAWEHERPYWKV